MDGESAVTDDIILERLSSLPQDDRATSRANPFAIADPENQLVTADQVLLSGQSSGCARFACPKCRGQLRFYVNAKGTPFFAHATARGACPSGFETPSHLCIKRGLHSIGFSCEHNDDSMPFQFDAYHADSDTAVEVISSGTNRYQKKIRDMKASGRRCWWIADSGSKELGSRDGSEVICMRSFELYGHIIVSGLFKPKATPLFAAIGNDALYAFYYGLVWKACGDDRWQLLDEEHPLSKAATADDGMKCLMVRLKVENSFVRAEWDRNGISRKTWFDRTFRYRGQFTTTWNGDRDYIIELVQKLIANTKTMERFVSLRASKTGASAPPQPVHRSAEEILKRISDRHAASFEDARKLRHLANSSSVTEALSKAEVSEAAPKPLVIDPATVRDYSAKRPIVSSRWTGTDPRSSPDRTSVHEANRKLQQASASKDPVVCDCGCERLVLRAEGKVRWRSCARCGKNLGHSWIDRQSFSRR